jgi:hypothetical protein
MYRKISDLKGAKKKSTEDVPADEDILRRAGGGKECGA